MRRHFVGRDCDLNLSIAIAALSYQTVGNVGYTVVQSQGVEPAQVSTFIMAQAMRGMICGHSPSAPWVPSPPTAPAPDAPQGDEDGGWIDPAKRSHHFPVPTHAGKKRRFPTGWELGSTTLRIVIMLAIAGPQTRFVTNRHSNSDIHAGSFLYDRSLGRDDEAGMT